jgi:osmotically-inducible protein OsmY
MTTAIIKSDSQIKTDVLNELKWDSRVDETDVGVQIKDGIVTLVGSVDVYAKKIASREAAHRVHGVLDVVDELQVKVAGVGAPTDIDIARGVRDALEWDAFVPDEKITSTVSLGIVTLEGVVPTWSQRADAEPAAAHDHRAPQHTQHAHDPPQQHACPVPTLPSLNSGAPSCQAISVMTLSPSRRS